MGEKNPPVNRRTVLKAFGGSAATVSAVPTVSAQSNGAKFKGLAYDPVTHEIYGEASAQFNDIHGNLRGNLRVANQRVNMNKAEQHSTGKYEDFTKTKHGFNEQGEGTPTKFVRVTAVDSGITGYVQQGGNKVAYSLVPPKRRNGSLENLLKESRFVSGE